MGRLRRFASHRRDQGHHCRSSRPHAPGHEHDYFEKVLSILVYPSAFELPRNEGDDECNPKYGAIGQAVYRGPVILAWDSVLAEGKDASSGQNVVIHEFAHHLDYLDGEINGTPVLRDDDQARRWHDAMSAEFRRLIRNLQHGRLAFFDEHAATNETEFFAAASERFFVRPAKLKRFHPQVYAALADYFCIEPIRWMAES